MLHTLFILGETLLKTYARQPRVTSPRRSSMPGCGTFGHFAVRRLAVAANLAERLGERERATNYAKRATNRFWSRLRV